MRKLLVLLSVIIICLTFVGCAEITNTTVEVVEAEIIHTYYDESNVRMIWTGKSYLYNTDPADYEITVSYDGLEKTFDDEEFFNECGGLKSEGKKVELNLVTDYYDNGNIRRHLELIEEKN